MKSASILVVAALLISGCVTSPLTSERYRALTPSSKALFDKYHQFMTDNQAEAFLRAPDDDGRKAVVDGLHIEERLAKYPSFIQDAVKAMLFLAMGLPDSVDRDNFDPDSREIPRERWHYRRGPRQEHDLVVVLVSDQVIEVTEPKIK
jgi:hypothetical protein